jgi:hypothetical protein
MSLGKQRCMWEHTATLQAQMVNMFAEDPVPPSEFNPFTRSQASRENTPVPDDLSDVREMLRRRNADR